MDIFPASVPEEIRIQIVQNAIDLDDSPQTVGLLSDREVYKAISKLMEGSDNPVITLMRYLLHPRTVMSAAAVGRTVVDGLTERANAIDLELLCGNE